MFTKKQLEKAMPAKANCYADACMWYKRGGHRGDDQINKSVTKLIALGFKDATFSGSARPDGAWVKNRSTMVDQYGNKVEFGSSYGNEARDNSYFMNLTFSQDFLDSTKKTV